MERSVIRDLRSRIVLRSMRAASTPNDHDPQAQVRPVPAVFAQKGSAHRQAPQSRHVCEPAGRQEARARGAILQAPRLGAAAQIRPGRCSRMCRHCVCAASPIIHASRSSYLGFFEPVMRIWLVVERLDFDISALAIQRLRFCEGPIGLEPQGAQAKFPCNNFQGFEHAPTDAESTRIGTDPHALYFADISIFHFERAATDRLTAEGEMTKTPDGGVS